MTMTRLAAKNVTFWPFWCSETLEEDYNFSARLNADQRHAYLIILERVIAGTSGLFFVDGPGKTGKTSLQIVTF